MVMSLAGWFWAVSTLVDERLLIRCPTNVKCVYIPPPLQMLSIENGYEGYSPNIHIRSKLE